MDPFEMPDADTLRAMNRTDLEALRGEAAAALRHTYASATADGATPTDEQLVELEALDKHLDTIDAAIDEVKADEDARTERAEALRARLDAEGEAEAAAEGAEGDEDATEGAEAVEGDTEVDQADEGTEGADAKDKEPALTAGANRRKVGTFRAANLGHRQDDTPEVEAPEVGFRLAPGVPGYKSGIASFGDMAEAFDGMQSGQMVRSMQQVSTGTASHAATLGYLDRNIPENLIGRDADSLTAAIDTATNESNLEGNSLVAAGGWCAPSETMYDFLAVPAAEGLFSLPEIGIARGGIRWPRQPDFGIAMQEEGFLYTEAEAIAQVDDKPCFEIPCGEFDEVRLDAIGLCVTAGLLQQKGYPESIAVYMQGLMKMHLHRMSSYRLNKVLAGSDDVDVTGNVMGVFGAVMNTVELAAEDIRSRDRLPQSTTIEVVFPRWVRAAIRADLAYRRGESAATPATDQMIASAFAARNVAPQFVTDWQVGETGQPGAATPVTAWPTQVEFVAYPSGTWFSSVNNVIEVGNLYDQAMLKKNRFTALFTEDGVAVGKRGTTSRHYTVPVAVTGHVGAAVDLGEGDVSGEG